MDFHEPLSDLLLVAVELSTARDGRWVTRFWFAWHMYAGFWLLVLQQSRSRSEARTAGLRTSERSGARQLRPGAVDAQARFIGLKF